MKPKRGSKTEKEMNIKKTMQLKIRDNLEKAKKNVEMNVKIFGKCYLWVNRNKCIDSKNCRKAHDSVFYSPI